MRPVVCVPPASVVTRCTTNEFLPGLQAGMDVVTSASMFRIALASSDTAQAAQALKYEAVQYERSRISTTPTMSSQQHKISTSHHKPKPRENFEKLISDIPYILKFASICTPVPAVCDAQVQADKDRKGDQRRQIESNKDLLARGDRCAQRRADAKVDLSLTSVSRVVIHAARISDATTVSHPRRIQGSYTECTYSFCCRHRHCRPR